MADIKNEVLYRVYGVLAMIVVVGIVLFAQVVKIQFKEGDKWRRQGEKKVKFERVVAERGNILAEDGKLLATSLPFFEIRMDLNSTGMSDESFMNNVDSLAYCLATFVDNIYELTPGGYRQLLIDQRAAGERYMLIKKNVTYTELETIRKFPLFNRGQFGGGFIVIRQSKRDRPFKMLAHRTIGYIREGANKVGLEGFFDEDLGGTAGKQLMQKVGNDFWIPVNDLTEIEPKNGQDLVTTLNVEIQETAQNALVRALNYHDADHGCAIVMEVKTGAIKAIANIGKTEKGGLWETYNHAVGDAIEPGSTFKLAPMMALLDKGAFSLSDTIDLEKGQTTFYDEAMEDSSPHGLNETTVRRAFELSSNVGIAKMVEQTYGKDQGAIEFINQLRGYNLHLPTGIQIEGEAPPFIKEAYNKEMEWSGITLPWMSIGYEVLITPLQLLTFYNAVANDGQMMRPYLVSEIQQFGETTRKYKPTVIKKNIAKAETIAKAKSLLLGVVKRGTARKLATNQYEFAGKTGTAQIDYRKFKPRNNIKHRASFVGYFPAENPVYTCMVMVTNPRQNGIYGADVAGPVFREIADKCFASRIELHRGINNYAKPKLASYELPAMNIGKENEMSFLLDYFKLPHENHAGKDWTVLQAEADTITMLVRDFPKEIIPNVKGMSLKDALYVLENQGLNVIISGIGKVKQQSILAGTKARGQTIRLRLGN